MTEDPLVTTSAGRVRGFWRESDGARSAAFLGIPFAAPPVGALRFAEPVPATPWEGVRDATAHGATPHRSDEGMTLIPEPSIPGEDILNVNVFTPSPGGSDLLPVLVYIHGGGFTTGSPASPWYDGRAFNRDGVVTVTVSYRLGFDGFGLIEGVPPNRGVHDWLAALEWVQENIAAFGGDPGRVTIAGQSAGGGAVLTLLGMPAAQHLFHRAMAFSSAIAAVRPERAAATSQRLGVLLGVPPTLEGFSTVPEERIIALQDTAGLPRSRDRLEPLRELLGEGPPWGPVVDGDLVPQPTVAAIAAGVGADKPLLLGATDDEFTMVTDKLAAALRLLPASLALRVVMPGRRATIRGWLAANRRQRRLGTAAVLGRYATDQVFRTLVVRVAEARTRAAGVVGTDAAAPTWVYRFAWQSPVRRWALHCLDVPFWFDCLDAPAVASIAGDDPPRSLAAAMHGAATAFVRDGDPGWRPWSARPGTTRVFGGTTATPDVIGNGYDDARPLLS
ncbi:carboxylesterase family protein [Microbacterium sp. zg.Y1090]|uniref:carboxylesterase/lipase family protein n=1 Tax=Microbacterium TaxID=33882 RepID=UPI00214C7544|nr:MULTISPECIES: carboxylesterase family protein [unclassified Microbacterium]MCR2812317.1 carboxylesterase family protein [Microbacterium sp. zg.Y1084]MCR2819793.1 carboxylesterase family protein [Microbacterium sp. zg.Y1090]MDL5485474.1 carboxylesterase family protein [Microbacterium sp. zg-Y1211]WIM28648.1 carboxylesterase family protein [Microbacterium sp. zg-Y1090]